MSELLGVLQQIMQENQKAMKPTDIAFGIVMSTSPLAIQTDTMQNPIPEKALVLTDAVVARNASVQGGEGGIVTIHSGLSTGDKVIMLRVNRGNRYIVLSKAQ